MLWKWITENKPTVILTLIGTGVSIVGTVLSKTLAVGFGVLLIILGFALLLLPKSDTWKWSISRRLPALRPKIIPVRWGKTPGQKWGLIVRNDGEPAFDIVADEPLLIGKSKLDFWHRTYPHLATQDGELLIDVCITLPQGSITDGQALRDLMVKEQLSSLPFAIRYRGLIERPWFVTKFDVICEVWGEGLRIGNVRQERGTKP